MRNQLDEAIAAGPENGAQIAAARDALLREEFRVFSIIIPEEGGGADWERTREMLVEVGRRMYMGFPRNCLEVLVSLREVVEEVERGGSGERGPDLSEWGFDGWNVVKDRDRLQW